MSLRAYLANLSRSFGATVATTDGYGSFVSFEDEWRNEAEAETYLRLSPAVYMAVRYRSQKLASVPLTFSRVGKGGNKTKVTSGSLIELMSKVNPYWTAARLYEMSEMSLLLRGSSYWLLDRGQGRSQREPKEIWWLSPDHVKVIRGDDYVRHFEYDTGSGPPLQLSPDEVLWLRYPNPSNQFSGLAPLDAARIIADTGSAALTSNKRMFTQGMQLSGFVAPADRQDTWSKETTDAVESSLKRRFSGANNAHRWAVLNRQMTFQALTLSPKDIEFIALLKWSFEDICRVFGLSPDLLGGERTFSNAAEARLAFWQDTMVPECAFFANEITEQLLPLFPGQADVAEFDLTGVDVLQELEAAKWARWKEQIVAGTRTQNEERDAAGLKPVPWGDEWWASGTLVPIATSGAEITAAKEAAAAEAAKAIATVQEPLALPEGDPANPPSDPSQPRRRTRAVEYGSDDHERIWRAWVRRTDPHERKIGDVTADLMRRQRQSVLARLKNQRGRSTRDVAEVLDDPFDIKLWTKEFRTSIRPVLTSLVEDVGQNELDSLGLNIAFDIHDPNVTRFLIQRSQRFAVEVNETTYSKLQESLKKGIEAGEGIDDLAARVEAVMGDRIRSSAETIARSELTGAASGGQLISWAQAGVVGGKEWLSALDGRTRDSHWNAHGQVRALDKDFEVGGVSGPGPGMMGAPEIDINCRCTILPVVDVDFDGPKDPAAPDRPEAPKKEKPKGGDDGPVSIGTL